MTVLCLSLLIDRFRNWEFLSDSGGDYNIFLRDKDFAGELQELAGALSQHFGDPGYTIAIQSGRLPQITVRRNSAKKYGRLFTSGCFDVFHYGHLNILERSKALCDFLIVGVSTDDLIEKEKGRRPLIPYEERARVIESVKYVDLVVPQVDKNKQKMVDTYLIDAISVGDDWKGRYPRVTCAMEYFPYTENVSSTILKNSLQLTQNPKG
ncbi:MAG TPA: adenylyltransferase/cytidyltransferase family protein [Robiginitalea sp.]|nr:adenylyltransferase/cytidyltransferase family protein [Robiginitalea sp.]